MIRFPKGISQMVRTDYIIRIIEQFAAFLWAIIFNKKAQNYDLALEKIEEAYNGLLHLNANELKKLSADEIIKNNTYKDVLDKDNIEIISNLLFEEADIIERKNGLNIESFEYYKKSIELFFVLVNKNATKDFHKNIDEIITKLVNYEIDSEIEYEIYKYYAKRNLYGKAEDTLYQLLENNYPNIKDEIKMFYKKLLERDDSDLEKGNLPRNEIIDGIKELEYI
jgi:tetratricopeptide (TPR) repeat protein